MALVDNHRFNVEEYHRMGETGIIKPDARVELLDGRIVDMSPIGSFHGGASIRLNKIFNAQARERFLVSCQGPLRIDDHTELQPDVMILRPDEHCFGTRHPHPEDVLLLVEISQTSLDYDQGDKLVTYAKAGIEEYWIVNRSDQVVEVYLEPHYLGYESRAQFDREQTVSPARFPDIEVSVDSLFSSVV